MAELDHWFNARNTTKCKLLSLIGLMSFAARAVLAGRLFLRHLINLSTKVQRLHHHIRLNQQALADITWWKTFLLDWNGCAYFVLQVPLMPTIWTYTQMLPDVLAVVLTFRASGFTTSGSPIKNSLDKYPSSGKSSLPL